MQNITMIPKRVEILLKSEPHKTFRCVSAATSLDINVEEKLTHHLVIDNIQLPADWKIGLFYGASGSGKTTLAQHLFGKDIFNCDIDFDLPIIDQFSKEYKYEDCAKMLSGIGLTSVPCWIRPLKTLSNGQQARAIAAYLLSQNKEIVVIDEWTSVVDRTVAKAMSLCVSKYAQKTKKKIILLSCHYDIIEWIKPDWLIDCNKQQFLLPQSNDFFFQPREKLQFEVRECDKRTWKYFSKYHYLSKNLPGGICYFYGLFHNDEQIGFQCFANYTPHRKGLKLILHSNRTVIHPDYCGLGLGIKLIDESVKALLRKRNDIRIMAKFSAIPTYIQLMRDPNWKFISKKYQFGTQRKGGNMERNSGFRDSGARCFLFEWANY